MQFDLSAGADAIAALEQEIDEVVRPDVALVDQLDDGAVHDADTSPEALLGVVPAQAPQERKRQRA